MKLLWKAKLQKQKPKQLLNKTGKASKKRDSDGFRFFVTAGMYKSPEMTHE